jgi:hypothetical protein
MPDLVLGQKLSDAAREYANATIAALTVPGGVHPPTAVAACARMAGTYLFRTFDLKLAGVRPGQAVLSKEADDESSMLLRVAAGILGRLGVTISSSPGGPLVDERHKPMLDFLATQRLLESRFSPIKAKYDLASKQAAQAAAIATALLVHHFTAHLAPDSGFGLAALGFVEGTKTAPDPLELPEDAA